MSFWAYLFKSKKFGTALFGILVLKLPSPKEEETYRAFHIRDFGTLWTQLGAQSFKTEELSINVPALGAQERRI